jgi:hypothetical protein
VLFFRYGETHPVFYVGSLDNAIKDALVVSAKEVSYKLNMVISLFYLGLKMMG